MAERAITHKSDKFVVGRCRAGEVEAGWRHALALHETQIGLPMALQAAERAWGADPSEATWARIVELQERLARRSRSGGSRCALDTGHRSIGRRRTSEVMDDCRHRGLAGSRTEAPGNNWSRPFVDAAKKHWQGAHRLCMPARAPDKEGITSRVLSLRASATWASLCRTWRGGICRRTRAFPVERFGAASTWPDEFCTTS